MYIYGVLDSSKELFFGPHGVTACEEVYTVSYQDISLVVCDSQIVDYSFMSKPALAGLLVEHQKVIEKIMNLGHTIVPLRLGTFLNQDAEIENVLSKSYSFLKDIVEKVKDKIEIDLAATWNDFNLALKEAGQEQEIKEIKERLLANSKKVTVEEQMKVGLMVKKALDKRREKYAEEIKDALKTVSQDVKIHELMDDKMVANCAVLIDKSKQKEFDQIVKDLNTKFAERLNFRSVGPLPAYSFYTLEIKKMQFEEVNWARKKLGLSEAATKEEITKAHKLKALSTHPDRNSNMPDRENKFDEVTKAYEALLDYCQEPSCSFREEDFRKNSLIVKVRQ